MKKIATVMTTAAAAGVLALSLAGCASQEAPAGSEQQPPAQEQPKAEEPKAPLSLEGDWKQSNSKAEDAWMEAEIADGAISIDWVSDNGDTKSVYWVGTFPAPDTTEDAYDFASERDKAATDAALMASTADTKEFEYKDGVLSCEVSALGTTTVVKFERAE